MKKAILMGISLLFMLGITIGQEKDTEQKLQEKVTMLTEKLQLNEEQQASIHTILKEAHQAKTSLKADQSLSEDIRNEQIRAIQTSAQNKILEVLTEDQKVIFQELKDKKEKIE